MRLHVSVPALEPSTRAATTVGLKPTSSGSGAARLLQMQRSHGNRFVQRALLNALQTKLTVNRAGDQYEQEADRVADTVMSMPEPALQRQCACGKGTSEGCAECQGKSGNSTGRATVAPSAQLRRLASCGHTPVEAPPSVAKVLQSPGQPLPEKSRQEMESRLGRGLDKVVVHDSSAAHSSAEDVSARAYTVGNHVIFGRGQFQPDTATGRRLLIHELVHVMQQEGGVPTGARPNFLQRAETLGSRLTQPKGAKSSFKKITATFDGQDFVLLGDGTEILRASGQSGRPNQVKAADAKACGGSPDDSYMNNPRYVGIADSGPIPEGEYTFRRTDTVMFNFMEENKMRLAGEGKYVDPSGLSLHGDWGAGRTPLRPLRIVPAKLCGNTRSRSGFYLHGGVMPGSSGCIDIGDDAIRSVGSALLGYTDPVHLIVKYTKPAPDVGFLDRAAGRFMYPPGKDPSLVDRLNSVFGGGDQ